MLSPTSILLGFVLGAIATAFAFYVRYPLDQRAKALTEITSVWDLRATPRLIVERVDGFRPPAGSKVLLPAGTPALADDVLASCEVRTHPGVHENAALGDRRALVFTSHVRPGVPAVSTTDPAVLTRLEHEWDRLWKEAEPYAPAVEIRDVPRLVGSVVEVRGVDAGMTEYRGRQVLRLESDGHALPVLVQGDPGLSGQPVRVIGKVVRAEEMTYLQATKILPLGRPRVAVAP